METESLSKVAHQRLLEGLEKIAKSKGQTIEAYLIEHPDDYRVLQKLATVKVGARAVTEK
jgi:hypothetical protein